jgi:hypothetical protein
MGDQCPLGVISGHVKRRSHVCFGPIADITEALSGAGGDLPLCREPDIGYGVVHIGPKKPASAATSKKLLSGPS